MSTITLDPILRSRVNGLDEPVEIRDEAGQVVGQFLPTRLYQQMLHRLAEARCPYSSAELQQFQQEAGGQTLAQFWQSQGQQ